MTSEGGAGDTREPQTRLVPTALALLALVPVAGLLWWALAGPRPEPAPLDWSTLGFAVTEQDVAAVTWREVPDPEWLLVEMAGLQADLGGKLDHALPIGPDRYAAVVRVGEDSTLSPLADLAGVVEWSSDGDDPLRCAFPAPVPLKRLREASEPDELDETAIAGRCTENGPLVAVPIVRRHAVPQGGLQRLVGQRADSAVVTQGAVVVTGDGAVDRRSHLEADDGLPAYPREVARDSMLYAEPANPAAEIGSWADPVYPLPVADDGRLWWIMPVTPLDGADTLTGFQLVAADELAAGSLNPVETRWLESPATGPGTVIERATLLLERLDNPDAAGRTIRPTLPSEDGVWHGRVGTVDDGLRFRLEMAADGVVCLARDDAGTRHCHPDQATAAPSARQ